MEFAQISPGEQFLWFSKHDLLWFNRIFLLFDSRKSCVLPIFLLRGVKASLCPNINFDSVDFSERRPEEVTSFLWRSVYQGLSFYQTWWFWMASFCPLLRTIILKQYSLFLKRLVEVQNFLFKMLNDYSTNWKFTSQYFLLQEWFA